MVAAGQLLPGGKHSTTTQHQGDAAQKREHIMAALCL